MNKRTGQGQEEKRGVEFFDADKIYKRWQMAAWTQTSIGPDDAGPARAVCNLQTGLCSPGVWNDSRRRRGQFVKQLPQKKFGGWGAEN